MFACINFLSILRSCRNSSFSLNSLPCSLPEYAAYLSFNSDMADMPNGASVIAGYSAAVKLVTDGILRGCGMMVRFMIATFSDLILRVGIAIVLSSTALGSTGIWMAWPVGWCIGTGLSLVFYFTAIRKVFAESPAKAEAEGKAAELRAEAEFAADAEMEVL